MNPYAFNPRGIRLFVVEIRYEVVGEDGGVDECRTWTIGPSIKRAIYSWRQSDRFQHRIVSHTVLAGNGRQIGNTKGYERISMPPAVPHRRTVA